MGTECDGKYYYAGLLMGDDIKTGRSKGSDYWAALSWLSENQNKQT